jgi:UrcA family protein
MIRALTSTIIAVTAIASVAPALAAPTPANEVPVSKTISYVDLALSHSAGIRALHFRVEAAIRSVCGEPDLRDLAMMQLSQRCRVLAKASTASQIALAVNKQQQMAARYASVEVASH